MTDEKKPVVTPPKKAKGQFSTNNSNSSMKSYRGHWRRDSEEPEGSQEHRAEIRGEVIDPEEFRSGKATWRIFRIMSEFVEGYDFLSKLTADITFFGSARLKPGTQFYDLAHDLAGALAKEGFSIVTGGGPGIMEAANKGAFEAGGESIGLNIQLPFEQRINDFVHHGMGFHFFFTRKVMLTSPSQAFVGFPGGFGTIDEIFEVFTLIQTHKMQPVPVILVGKEFWGKLEEFISEQMLEKHGTINAEDMKLYTIVDTVEEAMEIIRTHVPKDDQSHRDTHQA